MAQRRCVVAVHSDCIVATCSGRITIHHLRRFGEPKSDKRILPLCEGHHLYDFGEFSIERIGKKAFGALFGLDLEKLIINYNALYEVSATLGTEEG